MNVRNFFHTQQSNRNNELNMISFRFKDDLLTLGRFFFHSKDYKIAKLSQTTNQERD